MRSVVRSAIRLNRLVPILLILTLTAGINAALFAVVLAGSATSGVKDLHEIDVLYQTFPSRASDTFSESTLRELRDAKDRFTAVGADVTRDPTWRDFVPRVTWGPGGPPLHATAATAGFFEALGVTVVGRSFETADDIAGAEVAIASERFVSKYLGVAPRDALGRELNLGSIRATLIGVVPADFHGPRRGDDSDLWLCFGALPRATGLPADMLSHAKVTIYVRRAPYVTRDDAIRSIGPLRPNSAFLRPLAQARYPPWLEGRRADDAWLIQVLIWTSALLLIGGTLSLCTLEIAHAEAARAQIAIMLSLGATPGRLVRRQVAESLVPAVLGTASAAVAAHWALAVTGHVRLPDGLPVESLHAAVNEPVLAFAAAVCGLQVAISALLGISQAVRRSPAAVLRAQTPVATGSTQLRAHLLGVHAAATVVLLVGSLVFVKTVHKATTVDLGFAAENVLQIFIQPGMPQMEASGVDLTDAFQAFMDDLNRQPGVVRAAIGALPLQGAERTVPTAPSVRQFEVGPGYAEATGLALIAGRDLIASDAKTAPKSALVNESFARRFTPPLVTGSTFEIPAADPKKAVERFTVVGVWKDALRFGLRGEPTPAIYVARQKDDAPDVMVSAVVRVHGDAESAVSQIEKLARTSFPNAARLQIRTAADEIGEEFRGQFLAALFFSSFATVAVTVAFVSVFGLITFIAVRGARETAIRVTLGATTRHVLWGLCRHIAGPVIAGLAAGELVAAVGVHYVSGQLFGISAGDPLPYVAAAAVILPVAATATWCPLRVSLRSDLLRHLRES
jgi:predicted permease